ncbi:site-2 protease family protein [Vulgatibacter sp.]|uniref:site-2 protease family protein n=1 Tax=Vulgatibacter sp. TaxID=1971226 RepID=UPI003567B934
METRQPYELAAAPARPFPVWNVVLFGATILTTLTAGADFAVGGGWTQEPADLAGYVRAGVPFSLSLLAILVAHEMGHFVAARLHRVEASWPWFIPVPFAIGTMGAVIRMRGRIRSRNALIDIGASGPLAGAVVAIPVLVYGISLSSIGEIAVEPNFLFGNLSLVKLLGWLFSGEAPFQGLGAVMEPQPLLYVLVKKLLFGVGPAQDVFVHPVAYAGVIGLFVTALNLVPIGQLDGGHVAYAVLGRKAERVGRAFGVVLVVMALLSSFSWLVWYLLASRFVKYGHPPVDDEAEPLSRGRKLVVAATVLLFLLTLTPVAADVL